MITRISVLRLVMVSLLTAVVGWGCCEYSDNILNIGAGVGRVCPGGGNAALGCSLSPNPVPTANLDIYVNTTAFGAGITLDVYKLIIGIPLAAGVGAPSAGSLPQIDQVVVYNPYPGAPTGTYGTNRAAADCGNLSSGETNAYYECMSGSPPSGGNTFSAWYGADHTIGVNPASFELYFYDLTTLPNLGNHGLYDIALTGNLPIGTIEIAYGCASDNCNCYVTPWSNAGQVVPEPSSLFLVGGAALALLGARFWRRKRS